MLVALVAVAASTAVAVGLRLLVPGTPISFLPFVPAILMAASYGGYWPALLATLLGGMVVELFLRPPFLALPWSAGDAYPLALYLVIGFGVSIMAGRLAQARADAQRRAREVETLFRLTPVGIGVANDPDCLNILVNPALAEMLHINTVDNASLSAPLGERPNFVVSKDGQPVAPDQLPLQHAARHGVEVKNVELDVVRADGTVITLYEYAAPLFDDDGLVCGAVGAFLDITELKRAEERLRRLASENEQLYHQAQVANRLKDEFLATLSHELRTPLNALLGWIHLLRSGHLSEDKRERALLAIERSAQLQAQLTSDLLDVSSVITGKLRLQLSPTLLRPLVDDVMESVRPAAQSRGVTCTQRVNVDAPLLLDATRVQQIVANLVANAVKFTPRDGRVEVDVSLDDHECDHRGPRHRHRHRSRVPAACL